MRKEILELSQLDPEVIEARHDAMELLRDFRECTDPETKKAFKGMVYDALKVQGELSLKSKARNAVKKLHEAKFPEISNN